MADRLATDPDKLPGATPSQFAGRVDYGRNGHGRRDAAQYAARRCTAVGNADGEIESIHVTAVATVTEDHRPKTADDDSIAGRILYSTKAPVVALSIYIVDVNYALT